MLRLAWILLVALLAAAAVVWWRTRVFNETGSPHHRVLWGFGTFAAIDTATPPSNRASTPGRTTAVGALPSR